MLVAGCGSFLNEPAGVIHFRLLHSANEHGIGHLSSDVGDTADRCQRFQRRQTASPHGLVERMVVAILVPGGLLVISSERSVVFHSMWEC